MDRLTVNVLQEHISKLAAQMKIMRMSGLILGDG